MQTWGIPADSVAQISKQPPPNNLYYEIAERLEKITKAAPVILYDTFHLPETENLYYKDHKLYSFESQIVEVFQNVQKQDMGQNIVILKASAFYPTSGGQMNDLGKMTIDGTSYEIIDVEKVGNCVLHFLDKPLPDEKINYIDKTVTCEIDEWRRSQLRAHHTGTHVIFAACR